ncbi:MAG: hypothetical protein BWX70_00342 [Verrucomicrobia bacterium ADurb.Bin070]|nr:MAG: hypothetical protein BWX70_00342 [Verrucomicrobia bacterium ADurb.Bin070]
MHISSFWTVAGLVTLCTCGVGCSSVTSAEYTRGIIQSGRVFRHTELPLPPSDNASARVKVACFTESRKRHAGERHSLWLVYLPLACTATTWERSDWLLWGSDKGGYKPAGLDMAEAIRNELEQTFSTRASGPIAAYYGRYPEQFGYPYDELLKPLTADLIAQLNRLASNVQ